MDNTMYTPRLLKAEIEREYLPEKHVVIYCFCRCDNVLPLGKAITGKSLIFFPNRNIGKDFDLLKKIRVFSMDGAGELLIDLDYRNCKKGLKRTYKSIIHAPKHLIVGKI